MILELTMGPDTSDLSMVYVSFTLTPPEGARTEVSAMRLPKSAWRFLGTLLVTGCRALKYGAPAEEADLDTTLDQGLVTRLTFKWRPAAPA